MQSSSPAVGHPQRERLTPDQWIALVAADERQAVRELQRGRNRSSLLDYYDAANEDSEGRLPHEAGYCGRWAREANSVRALLRAKGTISEKEVDAQVIQLVLRFAEAA